MWRSVWGWTATTEHHAIRILKVMGLRGVECEGVE